MNHVQSATRERKAFVGAPATPGELVQTLRMHAEQPGAEDAIRCNGTTTSYSGLERDSGRIAAALAAAGAGRGARVAVLGRNHPMQVAIWWGALKCGAVLVPINYRLLAHEVAFILDDSRAGILFVGTEYLQLVADLMEQGLWAGQVIAIDGGHPAWSSLAEWSIQHEPAAAIPVEPGDVALQLYTSGTTATPKGVAMSYANLLADLTRITAHRIWQGDDVMLMCMPMCHLGGSFITLRCICFGVPMVLMEAFDAERVLDAISTEHVTKAVFVPTMLHQLLEAQERRTVDLSSLTLVYYGAGAMPYELLLRAMRVLRCGFGTGYGMTETCGAVTYLGPEDHVGAQAAERMKSCGRPDGAEIRVVDANGNDLPQGEAGEIICRSPQVMVGYFEHPEETGDVIRDGWLHTGDVGYFDADGYLYVSDRIKDMIKSGGINLYPREIEEAMLQHPAVEEIAVIGVPDPVWNEVPKALVVLRVGYAISGEELVAFAGSRMARFKVPRSVDFIDALPRNTSGKVLKRELRKPYWEPHARMV